MPDTDYNGGDLIITANTTLSGRHYNIRTFRVASGVTLTAGTAGTEPFLTIEAINVEILGVINGEGRGYLGGNGGTGGNGGSPPFGSGQPGAAGANGGGPYGGAGGAGGTSDSANGGDGSSPVFDDTSTDLSLTPGSGGGGGGGGKGGDAGSISAGGGGGGGGGGGNGSAAIRVTAYGSLLISGTGDKVVSYTASKGNPGEAGANASGGTAGAGGTGGAGGYGGSGNGGAGGTGANSGGIGGAGAYGQGGGILLHAPTRRISVQGTVTNLATGGGPGNTVKRASFSPSTDFSGLTINAQRITNIPVMRGFVVT